MGEGTASQESVVLASFGDRRAAEHMLASLGRGFRRQARKGHVTAFVVSGNSDGSLKLTESRVVTAGSIASAVIRVSISVTVGRIGMFSTLKGAKTGGHAAHVRQAHVGEDEQAAHAILAKAGPHAAIALICCHDAGTRHTVTARAADRAIGCARRWASPPARIAESSTLDTGRMPSQAREPRLDRVETRADLVELG